jgi:hypothetical protein
VDHDRLHNFELRMLAAQARIPQFEYLSIDEIILALDEHYIKSHEEALNINGWVKYPKFNNWFKA